MGLFKNTAKLALLALPNEPHCDWQGSRKTQECCSWCLAHFSPHLGVSQINQSITFSFSVSLCLVRSLSSSSSLVSCYSGRLMVSANRVAGCHPLLTYHRWWFLQLSPGITHTHTHTRMKNVDGTEQVQPVCQHLLWWAEHTKFTTEGGVNFGRGSHKFFLTEEVMFIQGNN